MLPSEYRADIDGLRAVAVLAVVLHHLSAGLAPGGYVGVDVFFVISGYLITKIINKEMREGCFTFSRFYERRVRRIFPALFAVIAVTLAVSYVLLLPSDFITTLHAVLGSLFFSSNIVFWRSMARGYFAATDSALNPLLHTWSLSVEEQFYLLFPVLLLVAHRCARKQLIPMLLGCAVLSFIGAAALVNSKSVAVFFLSPFRAWELLVGSLLALGFLPNIQNRIIRELVGGLGLFAIVSCFFLYNPTTVFPGISALAPVLGAAAIIYAGAGGDTLTKRLLQMRPVVYIGLISYSLYLWHWPLTVFARYAIGKTEFSNYTPILFFASLIVASFSYHFIEQPFRRGRRLPAKRLFALSAAVGATFSLGSIYALAYAGLEGRFPPAALSFDKARNPEIPFVDCDNRSPGDWCQIGDLGKTPTTLLWGDSHLLAWAPALDKLYTQRAESAILAEHASCPPIFGVVGNLRNKSCPASTDYISTFLLEHREIKTVVMAGYWSTYFRDDGPLRFVKHNRDQGSTETVQAELRRTIEWLDQHEFQVFLIGPVPVYEDSIPLALALEAKTGHTKAKSTGPLQYEKHRSFFDAIDSTPTSSNFRFLDPIQWLCKDECKRTANGFSLYRDAHHLSVAGALALLPKLVEEIVDEEIGFSSSILRGIADPLFASELNAPTILNLR